MSATAWQDDPDVEPLALGPLQDDITADVCVIGLGGSGLAAIGEALRRGLSVVGVDAGSVAAGAAGRNGGFLLGGPVQPVHRAAEVMGTATAVDLYRATLAEIDRLEGTLGEAVIRRTGSIRLAGLPPGPPIGGPGHPDRPGAGDDRRAESADCTAQYEFMRAHDLPVERYDGPLGEGLFFPRDAAMNPLRRALGLAAVHARSARLFGHSPAATPARGRVVTPRGSVSAGVVVVAVDGGLETLLPSLRARVRTGRLQMAATAPLADRVLPCPVYARWGYDYLQQGADGRVYVGGGRDLFPEQEWTDSREPSAAIQGWLDGLLARVGVAARVPVTHRWGAPVGFTADLFPVVTRIDERVVACGGYSGTGNLIGPLAARAALAWILDGEPVPAYFAS